MSDTTRAKLASVYDGKAKFDETVRQTSITFELEDGRKLYANLTTEGGSQGARTRSRILTTDFLKSLVGLVVDLEVGEYNGKPSVNKFTAAAATPTAEDNLKALGATEVV